MTEVTIRRALLSVSDKSGVVELASRLAKGGVELVSTGGTARALREAGLPVRDVADVTGFPEMMDGRVKTLHPAVHGGLLAVREDPDHAAAMDAHEIGAIDLLVSNLYPFEETVMRGAGRDEIIENIDIGGPAMIRSGAKNHAYVTVVTDPEDYPLLLEELAGNDGATSPEFRKAMAAKAFAATAAYDSMISQWFAFADQQRLFPEMLAVNGRLVGELRYGENPHQKAALYTPLWPHTKGVAQAEQVQGKDLSYNNYADADAALELISEFDEGDAAIAIIKHANPCGVAQRATLLEAWQEALACDPVSAFGGIVASNRALDGATARAICEIFTEVVVAPGADAEARAVFAGKPNLRLLLVDDLLTPRRGGLHLKFIAGGLLAQMRDNGAAAAPDLKVVTQLEPTERQLKDMLFAWTVARHVKSNAIVFARDGATAGIGAGQMNRRDSARIAAMRAQEAAAAAGWKHPRTIGGAMASDAFLPFADGLDVAIEAGATAVIQPGGALRDDEVIARADEAGIAMAFTGMRHFRH
ncbi:MAG TPA: bifunctional phosphoribosylaminoimidazolecarboxamide formyltransferase/IMP cyclohydrolase [Croceibacterium sp.]|nr:bifunctional phosphoribosylaminoimidazolecarboxamide formyltransferase/IMP cyclohydrolase [Croceibacterium sp.]